MKDSIKQVVYFLAMIAIITIAVSPEARGAFYKTMWKVKNYLTVGTSTHYSSRVSINTKSAATKGVVARGVSGQTANMLEVQNSSGTALMKVASDGDLTAVDGVFTGKVNLMDATSDICPFYGPKTMFWNAPSGYPCYCDGSSADLKTDNSTACF